VQLVCLDLEGVLVPEIWIEFSKRTGIPELSRTTRDEPDYDKLMKYRLDLLKTHKLGLPDIQKVISDMGPMAGARDFLDALRREIRRSNPKYASVRYPALATAAELIAAQPRGSVLLSFVLGDEQSFAWAITGRGITAATLPARSALESQVGA